MQVFSHQTNMVSAVTKLREVMGVLQHHDAVSGTAKQHVTFDYAQRLSEGIAECSRVIANAYDHFVMPSNQMQKPPRAQFCHLLNITQCNVTENNDSFVVNVYNPLGRNVSKIVRLPVPNPGYEVKDSRGQVLTSQVMPVPNPVLLIPGRNSKAGHELIFKAEEIPGLGFKSFYVSKNPGLENQLVEGHGLNPRRSKTLVGYDGFKLVYSNKDGTLTDMVIGNQVRPFSYSFGWYEGHAGNNSKFDYRASGAYIFRPRQQKPHFFQNRPKTTIYHGPLSVEVHQEFAPFVSQVNRYKCTLMQLLHYSVGKSPKNVSLLARKFKKRSSLRSQGTKTRLFEGFSFTLLNQV